MRVHILNLAYYLPLMMNNALIHWQQLHAVILNCVCYSVYTRVHVAILQCLLLATYAKMTDIY
jgi:hypothetical protein